MPVPKGIIYSSAALPPCEPVKEVPNIDSAGSLTWVFPPSSKYYGGCKLPSFKRFVTEAQTD